MDPKLNFLRNNLPNLLEDVSFSIYREMWFLQDGWPAHYSCPQETVHTRELRYEIETASHAIPVATLRDVTNNVRQRAQKCLEVGGFFERDRRWDGVGTWLPPGVPRSLDSRSGSAQSISVSVRPLCPCVSKSGCNPFYSKPLCSKILERTICLVHLIASDWSRTSTELPHKVHCLIEARENPMTHPNIYECNDLSRRGNVRHPLLKNSPLSDGERKRIPPN
ncbi:hypothetical protein TNCV_2415191 [Trichonephila clavipes]|nr:hypothetical protein TNCV_2415191 [Trichonephila clavipes]